MGKRVIFVCPLYFIIPRSLTITPAYGVKGTSVKNKAPAEKAGASVTRAGFKPATF